MKKVNLQDLKHSGKNVEVEVNGQAGQDLFVIAMLEGKVNGRWLELGCGGPFHENNTLTLEKQFGWTGTSIDNNGSQIMYSSGLTNEQEWRQWRPGSKFINASAADYDFALDSPRVDYLQIDLDNPNLEFDILKKFTAVARFSVMTFEHDYWVHTMYNPRFKTHIGPKIRSMVRDYLQRLNYILLAADVVIDPTTSGHVNDPLGMPPIYFEDWWVDPEVISEDLIKKYYSPESLVLDKYWNKILLK